TKYVAQPAFTSADLISNANIWDSKSGTDWISAYVREYFTTSAWRSIRTLSPSLGRIGIRRGSNIVCSLRFSDFASVNALSNCLSCSAWIAFRRLFTISALAPNTTVSASSTTPPISKKAFHPSRDIDQLLQRILEITLIVCAVLALVCACVFPFVYHTYCNTKRTCQRSII